MSRTVTRTQAAQTTPAPTAPEKPRETMRDFVEQIVVAIILAILIRGFDAEAFVIPTGSMAPTLMGRHKEVTCPQCGHVYAVNASDDIEDFIGKERGGAYHQIDVAESAPGRLAAAERDLSAATRAGDRFGAEEANDRIRRARHEVETGPGKIRDAKDHLGQLRQSGTCVNCRYSTDLEETASFKGDRILVMKFPYELPFLPGSAGPKRWDVVVFHYPNKPETNYIKRLVGLPEEELRINHGDIQARPSGSGEPFRIQRKPPIHQRSMQMLVHDDGHRPQLLDGKPEWRRWEPAGSWREEAIGRFSASRSDGWSELRYRHLVPDPEQWAALTAGSALPRPPRPTLITDFYSYNTNINPVSFNRWASLHDRWLQSNWVGDLTLSCRVDLEAADPGSLLKVELIEAGVSHRCEVDLATGVASMYHGTTKLGEAATPLRGAGAHDVSFANVDDRLTLWVDGQAPFGDGLAFDEDPAAAYIPTARDLDPAGVGIKGAGARLSDLVLKRDIYYTQDAAHPDYKIGGVEESMGPDDLAGYGRVVRMFDFLADPARFGELKDSPARKPYLIRPDHFMMMGDNSPRSSDSRQWESGDNWRGNIERSSWEVPRAMLIGKAFFVYWPHGKPFGPDFGLSRDFRIPFRPYFERMKWIR